MSSFRAPLELTLLNHLLGIAAWVPHATRYGSLYNVAPTNSVDGTEVSTGAYARLLIPWGAAALRAISNDVAMTWTAAGAHFGDIVSVGICDHDVEAVDDCLAWDDVILKHIDDTESYTIPIGGLKVEISASGAGGGMPTATVNLLLGWAFDGQAWGWAPDGATDPYLALYNVVPSDAAAGTECTGDNGYERKQNAFDLHVGPPQYGHNTNAQIWTAGADWAGPVVGAAVCVSGVEDTADQLWWAPIVSATILDTDIFSFAAGAAVCKIT